MISSNERVGNVKKGKKIKVGIGFATGRIGFQQVLKTHVYNWQEAGLGEENILLNLLVAYDLKYTNTKSTDYTNVSQEVLDLIDDTYFIGITAIQKEIDYLMREKVIDERKPSYFSDVVMRQAQRCALYRNKKQHRYSLFLDDDEYPMVVTKTRSTAIWCGRMCCQRTWTISNRQISPMAITADMSPLFLI